jgi:hypothetical protein
MKETEAYHERNDYKTADRGWPDSYYRHIGEVQRKIDRLKIAALKCGYVSLIADGDTEQHVPAVILRSSTENLLTYKSVVRERRECFGTSLVRRRGVLIGAAASTQPFDANSFSTLKRILTMSKHKTWQLKNAVKSVKNRIPSLTAYEKLSLAISFMGALSLIFIYLQTRAIHQQNAQATVNMQASMYATIATQTLALDKIFFDNPALRPYFYGGQNVAKDDKSYDLVMATAEYQLDVFDAIQTQLGYIPDDPDKQADRDSWNNYFARSFATSPALCARIKANSDWYMPRLNKIAHDNCR